MILLNGRLNQKVLFISGAGHSGSTLFGLILGSHSKCFFAGETNKTRFFNLKEKVPISKDCKLCGPNCRIWNAIDINSSVDLYEQLSKITNRYLIVDSTKDITWLAQQINIMEKKNVKLYLIYLLRDGRAVINSWIRKYPNISVESHIYDWMEQIQLTNNFFNHFQGAKLKVHYEDLASYPQRVIKKICKWLEITYEPQMINFFNFDHHPLGGNSGTQFLITKAQKNTFEGMIQLSDQNIEYYSNHPLNIKLDLRWKKQLKAENLILFNQLTGTLNDELKRD